MESVRIEKATPQTAAYIATHARKYDRDELWAASRSTPEEVIRMGLQYTDAMVGLKDDIPVSIWGVYPESMLGKIGVPWLVSSEQIDTDWRDFVKHCRGPLMEYFNEYDELTNYVDVRNRKAIRWLRWLGFTLYPPEPYGLFQIPFHKFSMKKTELKNDV